MNTVLVVETRVKGHDRKLYQPQQLSQDELARLRLIEHELHCGEGLSMRQVQRELASRHGVRRSLGIIQRDLTAWSCERCQDNG